MSFTILALKKVKKTKKQESTIDVCNKINITVKIFKLNSYIVFRKTWKMWINHYKCNWLNLVPQGYLKDTEHYLNTDQGNAPNMSVCW